MQALFHLEEIMGAGGKVTGTWELPWGEKQDWTFNVRRSEKREPLGEGGKSGIKENFLSGMRSRTGAGIRTKAWDWLDKPKDKRIGWEASRQ